MLKDILEIVNFLKDNSATKTEVGELENKFENLRQETRSEFKKVGEEIISHVDGFVGLHQHLEIELVATTDKINRLERYIFTIAKHLQLQLDK